MKENEEEIKILDIKIDYCEEIIDNLIKLQNNVTVDIEKYEGNIREYKATKEKLGQCKHSYSKAMNQPSPRLCTKCNEPEEMVFVQTGWQLEQLQENCGHIYSRSMDQVYPRLCVKCGKQENI